jgi:hypothetical protein
MSSIVATASDRSDAAPPEVKSTAGDRRARYLATAVPSGGAAFRGVH